MNVIAIDTHEVVKELKAVGVSEDQAEAVTRVVRRAQDIDLSALATKFEIDSLRKDTKSELDSLRKDTKAEFESQRKDTKAEFESLRKDIDILRKDMTAALSEQKADLLKWIIGAIGFQTVAILGAVFALTHALRP